MNSRLARSPDSAVRVGDVDRLRASDQIGAALTQGYLDMAEYETRLARAFEAQTVGALAELVADLPVTRIERRGARGRAEHGAGARLGVRIHLGAYLAVSAVMIARRYSPKVRSTGGQ